MEFQTKPVPVIAEQMTESGMVSTGRNDSNDPTHLVPNFENYEATNWMVKTPNGIIRIWTDENFHKNYESTTKGEN